MGMTNHEIPRPTEGDVVELILEDHRLFVDLLRDLRDVEADREVTQDMRSRLGARWTAMRNDLLDDGCGSVGNVRRILERDKQEGLLQEGATRQRG
jgi:hypothetical protein